MLYNFGEEFGKIWSYIRYSNPANIDWETVMNKYLKLWIFKYHHFNSKLLEVSNNFTINESFNLIRELHLNGKYPKGPFLIYPSSSIEDICNLLKKQNIILEPLEDFAKALYAGCLAYYLFEFGEHVRSIVQNSKIIHKVYLKTAILAIKLGNLRDTWKAFVENRKKPSLLDEEYYNWNEEYLRKYLEELGFTWENIVNIKLPEYQNIKDYDNECKGFDRSKYIFIHPEYTLFNNYEDPYEDTISI